MSYRRVNGIINYFQVAAIVVVVIGISLRIYRQKKQVKKYSQELKSTVIEAKLVCEDLTGIMEDALGVSQIIIDDIDKKIVDADHAIEDVDQKIAQATSLNITVPNAGNFIMREEGSDHEDSTEPGVAAQDMLGNAGYALSSKVRVYNLAQEVGMSSKEMVRFIRGLGMEVVNHMNCLDDDQVMAIKKALQSVAKPIFKAFEQVADPELYLRSDIIEISKPHLVDSDADSKWVNPEQLLNANSSNYIISVEDLKKAHPYLAVRILRERGFSIRDIAKMLNRGQGEVSLIINLSARKRACS